MSPPNVSPDLVSIFPAFVITNDNSWHDINEVDVDAWSSAHLLVEVTAMQTDGSEVKGWTLDIDAVRTAGGTLSIGSSPLDLVVGRSTTGAMLWSCQAYVSGGKVKVKGMAPGLLSSPEVSWTCRINGTKQVLS